MARKKVTVKRPRRPRGSVSLSMPKGSLFVGSYHRIPVQVKGVALDFVRFILPDGARAGIVSPSRDSTFNPKRHDIHALRRA